LKGAPVAVTLGGQIEAVQQQQATFSLTTHDHGHQSAATVGCDHT